MIDWTKASFETNSPSPIRHRELVIQCTATGEVSTRRHCPQHIDHPSHDASIRLWSVPMHLQQAKHIRAQGRSHTNQAVMIDGNPNKYLNGHNLFGYGPEQHILLVKKLLSELNGRLLESHIVDHSIELMEPSPAVRRQRMDIATCVRLGHDCSSVHHWLDVLKETCTSTHRSNGGRPQVFGNSTVCFGWPSRRFKFVFYCKHCELKKHPPVKHRRSTENISTWMDYVEFSKGLLRIELRLLGQELRDYGTVTDDILWQYYDDKLRWNMSKDPKALKELRPAAQMAFGSWISGRLPRDSFSRSTFYRYRKEIKDATGYDIKEEPPKDMLHPNEPAATAHRDDMQSDYLKQRVIDSNQILLPLG